MDYPAPFGQSGTYEQGEYGVGVGAVSQWGDAPSEPEPGWQPRPMTGYGPLDLPPDGSAHAARDWQQSGDVPEDPWADLPAGGMRNGYGDAPDYRGGRGYGGGGRSGWGSFGEHDGAGYGGQGYGGQGYGQDPYGPRGPGGTGGTGRQPRPGRLRDDGYPSDPGPWSDPQAGGRGGGRRP